MKTLACKSTFGLVLKNKNQSFKDAFKGTEWINIAPFYSGGTPTEILKENFMFLLGLLAYQNDPKNCDTGVFVKKYEIIIKSFNEVLNKEKSENSLAKCI